MYHSNTFIYIYIYIYIYIMFIIDKILFYSKNLCNVTVGFSYYLRIGHL